MSGTRHHTEKVIEPISFRKTAQSGHFFLKSGAYIFDSTLSPKPCSRIDRHITTDTIIKCQLLSINFCYCIVLTFQDKILNDFYRLIIFLR